MADLNAYPSNMTPANALVARSKEDQIAHAADSYSAQALTAQVQGPVNPLAKDKSLKRNLPTGYAEEVTMSEYTFRTQELAQRRAQAIGTQVEHRSSKELKEEAARRREKREDKGDALDPEGFLGPWAGYKRRKFDEREAQGDEVLGSDEEYEEVTDDSGAENVVESGTLIAPMPAAVARRKEVEEGGGETSDFVGSEELDYQGRSYMHVPQDLDVDLKKEEGSEKNFVPKKLIHTWKGHEKAISGVRFFPKSGHLLLSAGAEGMVKIWDVYHQRELLRNYKGHTKAVSDITFNTSGTQFLSASYDRMIKLWDTETGQCINRFTTGKTPHVVRFNPDPEHSNEFVAGMSDKKIVQFDLRTKEVVQEYDHHLAAVNTITFVDENRRFITTSDDKSLRAWDYNIPVPIKFVAEPYMYPMVRSALHPSGKYVLFQSSDNQIVVFGATDKMRQNRKKVFKGHNNAGYAIDLDVSPDGQFVVSGDTGGYLCFWDWKTGKMWHKIKSGEGAVTSMRWHPQETSKVAAGGLDGKIRFYD